MKLSSILSKFLLPLLLLPFLAGPTLVFAQEDNTGTNPVNFTYDVRFYTEMADLAVGNGSLLTNTFELRFPLGANVANVLGQESGLFRDMGRKAAFRIKARHKALNIDDPDGSAFGTSNVSGIGDLDIRVMYMAYASQKLLVATAFEVFFNTATNSALGEGATSFVPQVFFVFPGVLGKGSLFVPGYQYVFDVAGEEDRANVSRSQIDLYFVWLLAGGKNWLIVDPQVVIDHANGTVPMLIEAEFGFMIAPSVGASTYIRPGAGFGGDKPYDWNLEFGFKFVWR